jgi:hypothetical protein
MIPQKPYEAPNRSHIQFRREFVYLNALYYLVVSCKDSLRQKLVDDLKRGGVALGIVTHAINKSQFQSVLVYSSDAKRMANDFEGFINLTNQQVFISSHRMLINYLHHILVDTVDLNLINLSGSEKDQLHDYGISSKNLFRIFDSNGIKIAKNDLEINQLKRLSATRNIIEHNNGEVNAEYLELTGYDLKIGDKALIGSKEVGEALAITEYVVQQVNIQAVNKWSQLVS